MTAKFSMRNVCVSSKIFEELFGYDAGSGVDREFHLADFLVDLLHEMNDKVHQLVFVHLFCVEVGDEEAYVVALHWFSPQDEEVLRSHHHEAHEFMAQDLLNLVCLLDSNADSDRVDGALDQNLLLVIAADDYRLEKQLFTTPYFHLWFVVALHHLGGEVLQAEGGLESGSHSIQVRTQGGRLCGREGTG